MPRIRDYPLLAHYCSIPCRPLLPQEARAADFARRFDSIARLLAREVMRLHRRLSPEGRVAFDPEDIFLAIWAELRRRDPHYDADRGAYTTFVATIIRHAWADLAPRARAVRAPEIKIGRPPDPDRDRAAARAGRDRAELPRALADPAPPPVDSLIAREDHDRAAARVAARLAGLSAAECVALRAMALWGGPELSPAAAARECGLAPAAVRSGLDRLRSQLPPPPPRRRPPGPAPPELIPVDPGRPGDPP